MKRLLIGCSTVAALAIAPEMASAHVSLDHVYGMAEGMLHPVTGLDHILAMTGVGVLAAQMGGRALWATPLSFMSMMVVGAALGMAHVALPFVELGIAVSVLTLGLVLLLGVGLPTTGAMALVGAFAIFHGYAHGAEMPDTAAGFEYGAGFVLATGFLHFAGISLGLLARQAATSLRPGLFRAAGATFTVAGLALITNML